MALNHATKFLSAFAMAAGATALVTTPAVAQFGHPRGGGGMQTQAPSRHAGRPYLNESEIRGPKVVYNIQEAHIRYNRGAGKVDVDLYALGNNGDPLARNTAVQLHASSNRNGETGNARHNIALYVKQADTDAQPNGFSNGYIATNLDLNLAESHYNQDKAAFVFQKFGTDDNNPPTTLRTVQFIGTNVKTILEDENGRPIVQPQDALDGLYNDALNGLLLGAGDITNWTPPNLRSQWKQDPVEISVNTIGSGFGIQP